MIGGSPIAGSGSASGVDRSESVLRDLRKVTFEGTANGQGLFLRRLPNVHAGGTGLVLTGR